MFSLDLSRSSSTVVLIMALLTKAKVYDIEDSNIALLGSDVSRNITISLMNSPLVDERSSRNTFESTLETKNLLGKA